MKRMIFCFLAVFLVLQAVSAETDFDIDTKIAIPPVYYVGDEVDLRLKIKVFADKVNIVIPDKLPAEEWIEIKRITYINFPRDVVTFNIFFVTFKPGKHILPTLTLGDVVLEGIEVDTQSITEKMEIKKITPKRQQIELPGTRTKIIVFILLVILVPLFVFFSGKYLLVAYRKIRQAREREIPKNRIRKGMALLLKKAEQLSSRDFYIQLADLSREYLSRRFRIPALTLTTRELVRLLKKQPAEKTLPQTLNLFPDVLFYCDQIKFGGMGSSGSDKKEKAEAVLKIVDSIEEELARAES